MKFLLRIIRGIVSIGGAIAASLLVLFLARGAADLTSPAVVIAVISGSMIWYRWEVLIQRKHRAATSGVPQGEL